MRDFDVQHRDALDSLAVARDHGGANLVLTSPPYPDARDSHEGYAKFDTSLDGYRVLGRAVYEALVPGGVCALNIDGPVRKWRGEEFGSERSLVAFEVALDWARTIGFRYVEHCAYLRECAPGRHGPRWRSGWEPVHVFARPGKEPVFIADGRTRPSNNPGQRRSARAARCGEGMKSTGAMVTPGRRMLRTAERWPNPHRLDHDHPAPFSADLADSYVLCYCPPGGLVCDPFVGSGTVALSCHRHGRRFVGGDLGHRERDGRPWADIVNHQLAQGRLFAPEGGHGP